MYSSLRGTTHNTRRGRLLTLRSMYKLTAIKPWSGIKFGVLAVRAKTQVIIHINHKERPCGNRLVNPCGSWDISSDSRRVACSVGWWLMAGAGLFWEKSTAGRLLVVGLFWEKSTVGWWLISQANRAESSASSKPSEWGPPRPIPASGVHFTLTFAGEFQCSTLPNYDWGPPRPRPTPTGEFCLARHMRVGSASLN
jgi:hypothetical protein